MTLSDMADISLIHDYRVPRPLSTVVLVIVLTVWATLKI